MTYPKAANVSSHLGDIHDWRNGIPGNPKTGEFWTVLHSITGGMPINMSNPQKNGKWLSGGPWLMWKDEVFVTPSSKVTVYRLNNNAAYKGSFRPSVYAYASIPNDWNTTNGLNTRYSGLSNRGAEAWTRMRPDLPDFSFALSAYELKDTLPVLKKALKRVVDRVARRQGRRVNTSHRSRIRRGGEFYLATQFGYIPIVRDIIKYQAAQQGAQGRLEELIRNNGRPQRRRRQLGASTVTTVTHSTSSNDSNMQPTLVTQCYSGGGITETVTRTTSELVWCVGRFRYLLPPGPRGVRWRRMMMRRIMGQRITARELYNAIPWSWLADYFTDLGHFVTATSPGVADRLVADYAYLMSHVQWKATTERTQEVRTSSNGSSKTRIASSAKTVRTIKMRVRASPFGFGLSQNDLTPHQASILGALGISRI